MRKAEEFRAAIEAMVTEHERAGRQGVAECFRAFVRTLGEPEWKPDDPSHAALVRHLRLTLLLDAVADCEPDSVGELEAALPYPISRAERRAMARLLAATAERLRGAAPERLQ